MKSVLFAGAIALIISLLVTPAVIKYFSRRGFGQEIRQEGPEAHLAKRGTPTMGGVAIILATVLGYSIAHLILVFQGQDERGPTASGLLALWLFAGTGVVGFLDDWIKLRRRRNLGLKSGAKLAGQLLVGISFAVLALQFRNDDGLTPASKQVSYVRDVEWLTLGTIGFILFAYLIIAGTSNAVNLTDGLDGLAAGSAAFVLISYVVVAFWKFGNSCALTASPGCYEVRDPLDLAVVGAAAAGACLGFLWWNAPPARIFMGDTGSLALGALLAALAILSRTELLLVPLASLFVIETLSVITQATVFKATKRTGSPKRVFRMAPLHHHFELGGWAETTVLIRFWILAVIGVVVGLGLFYVDWLRFGAL
jgi:phospho-N-acetylmuramoyl-pentapeptide-transferase